VEHFHAGVFHPSRPASVDWFHFVLKK